MSVATPETQSNNGFKPVEFEPVEFAESKQSQDFYLDGMKQLKHLIVGEEEAKLGLLTAMVMGRNIVLLGGTGSGKSLMARHGWKLIEDITQDEVLAFDTKDDLEGHEITGAFIPDKGVSNEEQHQKLYSDVPYIPGKIYIPGMVRPKHKVMAVNEFNRTSQSGLNTTLEAFEHREIEVSGHWVALHGLEYTIGTMNPGERKQNVHTVSLANASRFEIGAITGEDKSTIDRRRKAQHKDRFKSQAPEGVASLKRLHAIRNRAAHKVTYADSAGDYGMELGERIGNVFVARNFNEKGGRLDDHLIGASLAIATLMGEDKVERKHLDQAARFIVSAVLGTTSKARGDKSALDQVESAIRDVFESETSGADEIRQEAIEIEAS